MKKKEEGWGGFYHPKTTLQLGWNEEEGGGGGVSGVLPP